MNIDTNRLNGLASDAASTPEKLRFQAARDSFLPILVFNGELRGPTPGSVALTPQNSALLPAALNATFQRLVLEKLEAGGRLDVAIRDAKTVSLSSDRKEVYNYNAPRTLSKWMASDSAFRGVREAHGTAIGCGVAVGTIAMTASMQMIESKKVVNGEVTENRMPSIQTLGRLRALTSSWAIFHQWCSPAVPGRK